MNVAADIIASGRARQPRVIELAEVLSLALRCEPALIRQARLLIGDESPATEADLWFGNLVESHSSRGLVLLPDIAARLRTDLARRDPVRFERARALVAELHRNEPWSLRAEEALYHLSARAADGDRERCEAILAAVGERLRDDPSPRDLARWILRALDRLPPELATGTTAQALGLGAGVRLDGRLPFLDEDDAAPWLSWLPESLGTVTAYVRRSGNDLDLATHELPGGLSLPVPDTDPLVVDVVWHDGLADHLERVRLRAGESRRLTVTVPTIELRNLLGGRHALVPESGPETMPARGLDFRAIRARHRPFFGRAEDLARLHSFLDSDESGWFVVSGAAGTGKTALLCRVLDDLEAKERPVIAHFFEGGPVGWRRIKVFEASIERQLETWAGTGQPSFAQDLGGDATTTLRERLERMAADRTSRRRNDPLVIVIDGLHAAEHPSDVLALLGPTVPASVKILVSTRGVIGLTDLVPESVQASSTQSRRRKAESSGSVPDLGRVATLALEPDVKLCIAYLEHHARRFGVRSSLPALGEGRLFIAHTSRTESERAFTVRISEALQRLGRETFLDLTDLRAGDSFMEVLKQELRSAAGMVVIATKASADSPWLRRELELGAELRLPVAVISLGAPAFRDFVAATAHRADWWEADDKDDPVELARRIFEAWSRGFSARVSRLLDLADGYCGRLAAMLDWLGERPAQHHHIDRIPPTLYDGFPSQWELLADHPDVGADRRDLLLGLLAVAREPLAWPVIDFIRHGLQDLRQAEAESNSISEEPADDPDRWRRAAEALVHRGFVRPVEMEDPTTATPTAEPWYELNHPTLRDAIRDTLGPDAIREAHRALAELGRIAGADPALPVYRYACRNEVYHRLAIGDLEAATHAALDLDYLNEVRRNLGTDALFGVLDDARTTPAVDEPPPPVPAEIEVETLAHLEAPDTPDFDVPERRRTLSQTTAAMARVLRDLAERFGALPTHLAPALYHGLAELGWTRERLATVFDMPWDDVELLPIGRIDPRETPDPDESWPATAWVRLPDGRHAAGDERGALHLLEPGDSRSVTLTAYGSAVRTLVARWGMGSETEVAEVVAGYDNGHVRCLRPHSAGEDPVWDVEPHAEAVVGVAELPGHRVASWSTDGSVAILDGDSGAVIARLLGSAATITGFGCDARGRQGFTTSLDGTLRRWNLPTGEPLDLVVAQTGGVTCLAVDPSGTFLLTGGPSGVVRLWSVDPKAPPGEALRETAQFVGHSGAVRGVGFLPNARSYSLGTDGTARIWSLETHTLQQVLGDHRGAVVGLAASPSAGYLTFSDGGTARRWDPGFRAGPRLDLETAFLAGFWEGHLESFWLGTADGRSVRVPTDESAPDDLPVRSCAFAAHVGVLFKTSGRRCLLAGRRETHRLRPLPGLYCAINGSADFWVTATDTELHFWSLDGADQGSHSVRLGTESEAGRSPVTALCVSESGRWILTGHRGGETALWRRDWMNKELQSVAVLTGQSGPIHGLVMSGRETWIASLSGDGTAFLWSHRDERFELARRFATNAGALSAGAFSEDGMRLATGGDDHAVRLWTVESPAEPIVLRGHRGPVHGLAFTEDGRRLVSASADATLRLWDLATGNAAEVYHGEAGFHSLAHDRRSGRLAAGDARGRVRLLQIRGEGRPPPSMLD